MNLRKRKYADTNLCETSAESTTRKKNTFADSEKTVKKGLSTKGKANGQLAKKPDKGKNNTNRPANGFDISKQKDENIKQNKFSKSKSGKTKSLKSNLASDKAENLTTDTGTNGLVDTETVKMETTHPNCLPTEIKVEEFKFEKNTKSSKKKSDSPVQPPLKYEDLGVGPPAVPLTGKMYVGCHVSAAGGIWNSFENGRLCNASSIAMFLRNQRSWNAKPLDDASIEKWKEASKGFPPHLILPHGSYLMNLGSPNLETLKKSRALFVEELQRCEKLGIPHFNFHPGSSLGEISREDCCKLIAESINLAHKQTSAVICVIENMSKQGFTVGGDFHEIRLIIQGVEDRSRVGVCIDTCHAHAAGYDLATEKGFEELVTDFEKIIGWQFLRALHINDSKGKAGDHKDRHEVIGKGFIGSEGFKRVMNYPRFRDIPLILETPFVSENHYAKEIKLLQKMVKEN